MKIIAFIFVLTCVFGDKLTFDLVSDYTVNDCLKSDNEERIKYFSVDSDGFPYCAKYKTSTTCNPHDTNTCEPGLICGDDNVCKVDTTSCFKYFINTDDRNVKVLLWTPDCTADGSWAAKQCKGGPGGRCFCYDKKGTRLFGTAFEGPATDMTCACSRRKAELLDSKNPNRRNYVSFHCDKKGNFEELQCDSGHCWCADPQTGEPTSVIVPEKTMKFLKCYKQLKGGQYLRKCESIAYAQAKTTEVLRRRGVISPNIMQTPCLDDGGYGPYTKENSLTYCVSQTNTKSNYYSETKGVAPDCNCAHDLDLYKELGKSLNLKCDTNGNYLTFQKIDGSNEGFCVDKDGNKQIDNIANEKNCDDYHDYL